MPAATAEQQDCLANCLPTTCTVLNMHITKCCLCVQRSTTKKRTGKNSQSQKSQAAARLADGTNSCTLQLKRQVLCFVMYNQSVLASLKCACSTPITLSAFTLQGPQMYQAVRARCWRRRYQNAPDTTSCRTLRRSRHMHNIAPCSIQQAAHITIKAQNTHMCQSIQTDVSLHFTPPTGINSHQKTHTSITTAKALCCLPNHQLRKLHVPHKHARRCLGNATPEVSNQGVVQPTPGQHPSLPEMINITK
jgi:hypothetical protein